MYICRHTWYKCPYNKNGCWCPTHQLLRGSTANHQRGRFVKHPLSLTCSMYGILPSWFMLGRACWFQKHSASEEAPRLIFGYSHLCGQFTALFRLSYMNRAKYRNHFWNLLEPPKSMVSVLPSACDSLHCCHSACRMIPSCHPIRPASHGTQIHHSSTIVTMVSGLLVAVSCCFPRALGPNQLYTVTSWRSWLVSNMNPAGLHCSKVLGPKRNHENR